MALLTTDGWPVEAVAGFIRFDDVLAEFHPMWVRTGDIQRLIDLSGDFDVMTDVVLRGGEKITVNGETAEQIMLRMIEWRTSPEGVS